jgi:hypothetical protein
VDSKPDEQVAKGVDVVVVGSGGSAQGDGLAERTRAFLDKAHRQNVTSIREQLGEDNIVYDAINASRTKMRTPGTICTGLCGTGRQQDLGREVDPRHEQQEGGEQQF